MDHDSFLAPESQEVHERLMRRCFQLAALGGRSVRPNPQVGCVIAYNGKILGEGYHRRYGGPHAEVEAFKSIPEGKKHLIPESTLYVSLEPCNHHGKTPPCTDLIIRSGIKKVLVSANDPNPLMSSKSIEILRDEGIRVESGMLCEEALLSSAVFRVNQMFRRPHITLKFAKSSDGYMGRAGKQLWLTNESSRLLVHRWRSETEGIMVGTETVLADDPSLTNRLVPGLSPVRIVPDRNQRIPATARIMTDSYSTWVVTTGEDKRSVSNGKELIILDNTYDLDLFMTRLLEKGIYSLIVEGGRKLLESFIQHDLWDQAKVLTAPVILGSGIKAPPLYGTIVDQYCLDEDNVLIFNNINLIRRLKNGGVKVCLK